MTEGIVLQDGSLKDEELIRKREVDITKITATSAISSKNHHAAKHVNIRKLVTKLASSYSKEDIRRLH